MRYKPLNASIQEVVDLAKKIRRENDPDFIRTVVGAVISQDGELLHMLKQKYQIPALLEQINPMPFGAPLEHEFLNGGNPDEFFSLGTVIGNGERFLFNVNWLSQNIVKVGAPGFGKTNALFVFIGEIQKKGVKCWIFDKEKQDYRHYALKHKKENMLVFRLSKEFRHNPLWVPPGVSPIHGISNFVETFCKTNSLLDGSESLLLDVCEELFRERGIFDGSKNYPTLFDLEHKYEEFQAKPYSRKAGFVDSTLNRLRAYLKTNPELYNCQIGFPLHELQDHSVVFELASFGEKQSRFLINSILQWIFLYRIAKNHRGYGVDLVSIVDEALWAFVAQDNPNISFAPIDTLLRQGREFKMGIIAASQGVKQLDKTLFTNSFLKVVFHLGEGTDKKAISESLSLNYHQQEYINKLQPGMAICRFPGISEPFLVQFDEFTL